MGRRVTKNTHITSVRFLAKARKLTEEQALTLEAMIRRCRTPEEFRQVCRLVHTTCEENKKTRWAKIATGDPLGFDEPDD